MTTAIGCAVWIVVFAAVLLAERRQLRRLGLPDEGLLDWPLAAMLALGVTPTPGSVHGLLQALRQRLRPPAAHTGWRDGQTVHVGGVLEVQGPALHAPFSGRPSAY